MLCAIKLSDWMWLFLTNQSALFLQVMWLFLTNQSALFQHSVAILLWHSSLRLAPGFCANFGCPFPRLLWMSVASARHLRLEHHLQRLSLVAIFFQKNYGPFPASPSCSLFLLWIIRVDNCLIKISQFFALGAFSLLQMPKYWCNVMDIGSRWTIFRNFCWEFKTWHKISRW